MASITKRGNSYRVRVKYKGKYYTKTFQSKALAKEWANRKEQQLKSYTSGELGKNKTVADAFDKYAKEVSIHKKGHRWEVIRLERFKVYDFAGLPLESLKPVDIAEWRDMRMKEVSGATVRREMNLIGSVFSICVKEWNFLPENPVTYVKRPPNNKPRDRRVSDAEIEKLKQKLGYDVGVAIATKTGLVGAYFLLAIETGMRLGEMCKLRECDMFLDDHFVRLPDTKNGTSRNVPLSERARLILKDVVASNLAIAPLVASATFQKAVRALELHDLHFHDTRHEATTRLSKKLDIMDLARMTGHKDLKSLMVYYNATPKEIAAQLG